MDKLRDIPILEGQALQKHHFGSSLNETLGNSLFHISRLEDNRAKISFPLPPHRKTVYDLIFLKKGDSIRNKGLNEYLFSRNQVFCLPALQITSHKSMSEDCEGYFLHFSMELMADVQAMLSPFRFLKFHANPIITVPNAEVNAIENICERLLSLYENEKLEQCKKLIVWYMMSLFTELNRFSLPDDSCKKDTASRISQQFKDALTQGIYSYRTINEFADILNVSPNHLNKCVKKTLNKTAQSLLNEMLILEAKSLLKYSELSVYEIAFKLFKSTPSNFSRFFKKYTGLTPNEFRNQK